MYERFTERARQVVVLAQDEARHLKHNYIGTEHLLLGLLREEEGLASRALEAVGVADVEAIRAQVRRIVGEGVEATVGQIPFTPRAKKVHELALREALALGHNYIGTEHILLGLVREGEGIAARILLDFDAADKIRDEIIRMLTPARMKVVGEKEPEVTLKINVGEGMQWLAKGPWLESHFPPVVRNGKLNEATVAVLEHTIADTQVRIDTLHRVISEQELDLQRYQKELADALLQKASLEESLGDVGHISR